MTTRIREWSESAAGNNATVAGINFAEGQLPSTVNNSARELMAQVRAWYYPDEAGWTDWGATASMNSQTVVKLAGDQTAMAVQGRRVRLRGGSVAARYATVLSASFTSETAITLQDADGSLSASMSIVGFAAHPNMVPRRVHKLDVSGTLSAGSVIVSPGSVGAPALSFPGDTNTGFYHIGADNIGVALGGVQRLSFGDSLGTVKIDESQNVVGIILRPSHATYSSTALLIQTTRAATTSFNFGRWMTDLGGGSELEFNFSGDGNATCDGSWTGGGADYAEYFSCDPAHMLADAPGITVVLDGDKVRPAKDGEVPIGVSRPKGAARSAAVIGNNPLSWPGKYLTDEFGRYVLNDEGERVQSMRYDPSKGSYVERSQRDEWALIGLCGQIPIRDGQPIDPRWIRMKALSSNVFLWLVK